jgi:hypothetical protein
MGQYEGASSMNKDEATHYWPTLELRDWAKLNATIEKSNRGELELRPHPLVPMDAVLRTDPRYKWKPREHALWGLAFPVVVYIGSRIQFESKLIKADHRKAERMIEGYNRRASVNNAQFATHLDVEFPWFSGPEAMIEKPPISTATIVQPTLGVSGSVEEQKQSEFGDYNEAVRRYAEAKKTCLEAKAGDNDAWNNWLATNEEVQRAIKGAVATWESRCDENNENESCRSFDDNGDSVYLMTDEKFNEYNKLGEWRACELQQAQSHLEVAVRKLEDTTPDDARWWRAAVLDAKLAVAKIVDARRKEAKSDIIIDFDDVGEILETKGDDGERDSKRRRIG